MVKKKSKKFKLKFFSHEAKIQCEVLSSSGYGRTKREALSNSIKNFFDLLLEDEEHNYIVKKIILKVEKKAIKNEEMGEKKRKRRKNEKKATCDQTLDIENVNWNSEIPGLQADYNSPLQNFGDISAINNNEERRLSDLTHMMDLNSILDDIDESDAKTVLKKYDGVFKSKKMAKKPNPSVLAEFCRIDKNEKFGKEFGLEEIREDKSAASRNRRLCDEKEPLWKNVLKKKKNGGSSTFKLEKKLSERNRRAKSKSSKIESLQKASKSKRRSRKKLIELEEFEAPNHQKIRNQPKTECFKSNFQPNFEKNGKYEIPA